MIDLEDFRLIITAAYDGYGRAIKENQISVMHSQLRRFDKPVLKYALRKHCAESNRPPMISDILKHCGGDPARGTKTYDCSECSKSFELVYRDPADSNRFLCAACWYRQADQAGTTTLAGYATSEDQKIRHLAEMMIGLR